MSCKICNQEIPQSLPKQTRYCSDVCRGWARKTSKNKWHDANKNSPKFKESARIARKKYHAENKKDRNDASKKYYREVLKGSKTYLEYRKELAKRLRSDPEWIKNKKEKDREYYAKNKQTVKEKVLEYKKSNPAKLRVWNGSRKKVLQKATPKWLTKEQWDEMNYFYWLCKDLKSTTGEDYHVDHIIPLQGKDVCGLHVPWNLQVLPSDVNLTKGASV